MNGANNGCGRLRGDNYSKIQKGNYYVDFYKRY